LIIYIRDLVIAVLLPVLVGLVACSPAPSGTENTKSRTAGSDAQQGFKPEELCSALNDMSLVGGRWKEGATGFGCSTNEMPIGPRDASNSVSSAVWYEVRGGNPFVADTIVLGGDVRVPEAEAAVRQKMVELTSKLLEKLQMKLDDPLRKAIEENRAVEQRVGSYVVRYASENVGKVREDRLTIQRISE
jgi:hypothetical protein